MSDDLSAKRPFTHDGSIYKADLQIALRDRRGLELAMWAEFVDRMKRDTRRATNEPLPNPIKHPCHAPLQISGYYRPKIKKKCGERKAF